MAIYERTQRESAHVYSRVVDRSQVPSTLRWAALGCVTASKGELNHVYQCGSTDYLESVFGEPSKDHISLICASKIISDDNTMFLIRVAHENSLRGAQSIVSTETIYNDPTSSSPKRAIGVLVGKEAESEEKTAIQLKEENLPQNDLKNISSTLSFELDDENMTFLMSNKRVNAVYRDVYQIDSKGNKNVSNELCLLLSDIIDQTSDIPVKVTITDGGKKIDSSKYQTNWFYGDGYAQQSVIVLSPSAGVVENRNCDIEYSVRQVAKRSYGTASPNKVIVPVVIKSTDTEPSPEPGPDEQVVYYSSPIMVSDNYTI